MSKFGGSSALFLVDGFDFLAWKLKSISLKISAMNEQSDGLGDNAQAFTPVGKQSAMITQTGGFWDTAANNSHDAMATTLGVSPSSTPRVMCLGVMGNVLAGVFYGIAGAFSVAYEAALELSKLTKANAEHVMWGLVERGQIVQPLATKTADWNTHTLGTPIDYTTDPSQYQTPITSNSVANPSVVTTPVPHGLTTGQAILISGVSGSTPTINAEEIVTVISATTFSVPVNVTIGGTGGAFVKSSSVNGGAGYQQITAFSGFTGYVGKIRHSADETTYADLAVFTNATSGPQAQRVAVAAGTTINRFLVHDGDVTGTGSITAMSGFCRA